MSVETKSGIYQIKNLLNGKVYVGSTVNVKQRFIDHRKLLRKGNHHSTHLQNAWNKYGEEIFDFLFIEEVDCDKELLLEREQHWIEYYKSYHKNNGYNMAKKAGSNLGLKWSMASRKKLSDACMGREWSDESKRKLSKSISGKNNPFFGKKHSRKSKEKMGVRGEDHSRTNLKWEDVEQIRKMYQSECFTLRQLAELFNVHNSQISRIVNYKTWKTKK